MADFIKHVPSLLPLLVLGFFAGWLLLLQLLRVVVRVCSILEEVFMTLSDWMGWLERRLGDAADFIAIDPQRFGIRRKKVPFQRRDWVPEGKTIFPPPPPGRRWERAADGRYELVPEDALPRCRIQHR